MEIAAVRTTQPNASRAKKTTAYPKYLEIPVSLQFFASSNKGFPHSKIVVLILFGFIGPMALAMRITIVRKASSVNVKIQNAQ